MVDALPVKEQHAPLNELSELGERKIRAICCCLAKSLERAMKSGVAKLSKSLKAHKKASNSAAKFEVVVMNAGTTKDFYAGLEGRVAEAWHARHALDSSMILPPSVPVLLRGRRTSVPVLLLGRRTFVPVVLRGRRASVPVVLRGRRKKSLFPRVLFSSTPLPSRLVPVH